MRNKLLAISLIFLSSSAYADGPEVKLSGGLDFQVGYLKNKGPVNEKYYITGNNKNTGFSSAAYILADAHNTTPAGLEYGAKIGLATSVRTMRKVASSLYFISQAGKMELGSERSANAMMKITPYTNACATGGGWDAWVRSDPNDTKTIYMTNFGNFADGKVRYGDQSEYSRKVTYYTPEFSGFQIGMSYIPDTTNTGHAAFSDAQRHEPTRIPDYTIDIKNAFAGGITYGNKISDDMKFKIALVGETGKAIGHRKKDADASVPLNAKFKKLKAYTAGTQFDIKDFSFTAAFSDYMKSLTSNQLETWRSKNSRMYGFGVRYNHSSKVSVSLTYFSSKYRGNTMNATTAAAEYKGIQGLMPYVEVTYYKTKGKYIPANSTTVMNDKNSGVAVILGLKMEF